MSEPTSSSSDHPTPAAGPAVGPNDAQAAPPQRTAREERVEALLGYVLRAGVMAAALIVAAGGVLYLLRHGQEQPDLRVFHGEPAQLRTIAGIVSFAKSGHARGIIQLGLLVLLVTPVVRVALSIAIFARQRDWIYVVITLMVLAGLAGSMAGGFR